LKSFKLLEEQGLVICSIHPQGWVPIEISSTGLSDSSRRWR